MITHAKKSLGQNFLRHPQTAERIVALANLTSDDTVLEIGPGRGALTPFILEKTDHAFFIEKDEALAHALKTRFSLDENQIILGDACTFRLPIETQHVVIGNLPYNVATQIIFNLIDQKDQITRMIVMVQKEVALRFAAAHGSKIYGIPSVLLQAEARVRLLMTLAPTQFIPAPKVDSSVIEITPIASPFQNIDEKHCFTQIVKSAFSQRRKMILNTLAPYRAYFSSLGLSGEERAEVLSLETYLALTRLVSHT